MASSFFYNVNVIYSIWYIQREYINIFMYIYMFSPSPLHAGYQIWFTVKLQTGSLISQILTIQTVCRICRINDLEYKN